MLCHILEILEHDLVTRTHTYCLQDNAEQLQEKASIFEKQAGEIRQKMYWKSKRLWIILGVSITLLVIIIIVIAVLTTRKKTA